MRVLGLQLDIAWEDKPANHRKVRAMLESARPEPGELVILPEMFSTGFSMNVPAISDTWSLQDHAFLTQLTKDFNVWVLAGTVATGPEGKGRNQAILLAPGGVEIARYTKLHPFSPGKEAAHYVGGDGILLADVDHTKVSPFVCYDLRFPEAFRRAARYGAEVMVVIANWPDARTDHWLTLLKARAIENQAYVVGVNRCGRDPWLSYPGRSVIFGPKGELISELGAEEDVLRATLDPESVRAWRREFPALADMRENLWR